MMIDMEQFQTVSVDASGVASVGGGLRLGNMATAIYNQAGRALPHGTCPGGKSQGTSDLCIRTFANENALVGIGGHFSHGGYGYSSRYWGLALDTIVALDVVIANGTFLHATSTQNSDIYWALRGAADAIGIITTFYLQTQPAPASVVNFQYSFPNMYTAASKGTNAMLHLQAFAQNASVVTKEIGFGIYMDGQGFSVSGQYFGSLSDFNSKIAPEMLRTLPTPDSSSAQSLGWIDSLTALGGEGTLVTPVHGYDSHDNFFAKSVTVPEAQPLTNAGLTNYFNYIKSSGINNAPVSWFSIANVYGGAGSQINTKGVDFAAYSDRNSLWVFQHYGFVDVASTFPASGLTFVNGLNTALTAQQPNTGAYLNYIDPSLTQAQAWDLYYGQPLLTRLQTVKAAVDPNDMFTNPLAI
jgi:hypothetical protein